MDSVFSALESARQALNVSQLELEVAGQNISNAATAGYTRQRVDTTSLPPDNGGDRVRLNTASAGRGVTATGVEQTRDSYLDARYRTDNAAYSYYQQLSDTLSQVEDIVNELSTDDTAQGLGGEISDLESSLQKLQASPDDANVAGAVRSAMDMICQTTRLYAGKLQTLSSQVTDDLKLAVDSSGGGRVNDILTEVTDLNRRIAQYELGGQSANELRDQRNNLLDELSGYADVQAVEQPNGMVVVSLQSDSTHPLVDAQNVAAKLTLKEDAGEIDWPDGTAVSPGNGKLQAYLEALNGDGSDAALGIPSVMTKLDGLAESLVSLFNGTAASLNASAQPLLQGTDAATLSLSDAWQQDAALFTENCPDQNVSDYTANFVALFSAKNTVQSGGAAYNGTLGEFADSISVDVANRLSNVNKLGASSAVEQQSADTQRQTVSGVSINEEAVNIIKYQQSYAAAAKIITTVNSMLDALMEAVG